MEHEKTSFVALGVVCAFLIVFVWFMGNALVRADEKVKAQESLISAQREYIQSCEELQSIQANIIKIYERM